MGKPKIMHMSHHGFDKDSAIAKFTRYNFEGNKQVPCLYRRGKKFASMRMLEIGFLRDLMRNLPQKIVLAPSKAIKCYKITKAEAFALNVINEDHCNKSYGGRRFSVARDYVVSVNDVEKFLVYLNFAKEALSNNFKCDTKKMCGYIGSERKRIPYVLVDKDKGVPWKYCDTTHQGLKKKLKVICDWELAYLKLCCIAGGIEDLTGSTLPIVKVSDVEHFYPKLRINEMGWPSTTTEFPVDKSVDLVFNGAWSINHSNSKFLPYPKPVKLSYVIDP